MEKPESCLLKCSVLGGILKNLEIINFFEIAKKTIRATF